MIWAAIALGSLGCYALKFSGYLVPTGLLERPLIRAVAGLLPIALLASLVVVQTAATGSALVVDARLVGLVAAVAALLLRAPFLVVVVVAAVAAAAVRALGWSG